MTRSSFNKANSAPRFVVGRISYRLPMLVISIFITGLSLSPVPCYSQNFVFIEGKGPAFTKPPKDNKNYQLMGEYFGKLKLDGNVAPFGLQLRVVGKDRFEAIAYPGGLPGQPKFEAKPIVMEGRRSGDMLILSGGPWAVFVESKKCSIVDKFGNVLGQLKKVHRVSPTMHSPAPEGAVVLFDGTGTDQFTEAAMTTDGLLKEGASLKPLAQDFNLHIEFLVPYMPEADGQKRGNSGLYLLRRYECQILDSFATLPVKNGCVVHFIVTNPPT